MLKFHATPGGLTPWPNSAVGNQVRRYVGRVYDAEKRAYPAAAEPSEVQDNDEDAVHLLRKCTRGELWPADEHTASAAGVKFVELERGDEGEWFAVASKKTPSKPQPKPSASKD